jgi:hypothetical protein
VGDGPEERLERVRLRERAARQSERPRNTGEEFAAFHRDSLNVAR